MFFSVCACVHAYTCERVILNFYGFCAKVSQTWISVVDWLSEIHPFVSLSLSVGFVGKMLRIFISAGTWFGNFLFLSPSRQLSLLSSQVLSERLSTTAVVYQPRASESNSKMLSRSNKERERQCQRVFVNADPLSLLLRGHWNFLGNWKVNESKTKLVKSIQLPIHLHIRSTLTYQAKKSTAIAMGRQFAQCL